MKMARLYREGRKINVFSVEGESSWFMINKYSLLEVSEIFHNQKEIESLIKKGKGTQIEVDFENEILPPAVGIPEKIIGVGLNYMDHIKETGRSVTGEPIFFAKFSNTLAGHNEVIPIKSSWNVDYEGELGVILGKKAKNISEREAEDTIGGFFVANDLSARYMQYLTSQYLLGKTPDKFFPNGPFIVTIDEIPNYQNLRIRTYVNGELRQDGNTSQMIYKIPFLISYLSRYLTLLPGDVISTGTPAGVIAGFPEGKRVWLKSGDNVVVGVEDLGKLKNKLEEI